MIHRINMMKATVTSFDFAYDDMVAKNTGFTKPFTVTTTADMVPKVSISLILTGQTHHVCESIWWGVLYILTLL